MARRLSLGLAGRVWLLLCLTAAQGLCQERAMQVSSPDFRNGGKIPPRFTCDGENASPLLRIAGAPASAKSLVLIVDDPDAPGGTFTHWLVWNIGVGVKEIAGAPKGSVEGRNDFGRRGYGGPCPPSGTHRYFFRVYALDVTLSVPAGAGREAVEAAMKGHVQAEGTLVGVYGR